MKNIVGYLIDGHLTEAGGIYNYISAGNGIFISSSGTYLTARIPIAEVSIRGLRPYQPFFALKHGLIPARFFDLALSVFLADPERERYVAIAWDEGYQLYIPAQTGTAGRVEYLASDNIVCELHSHCGAKGGPCFSGIDDADEQGFKVYGVVSDLDEDAPCVNLRLGVYGYYHPLRWGDVFEGELSGVVDVVELMEKDNDLPPV